MKNIKILLIVALLPILTVSCGQPPHQQIEIKNITNTETLILKKLSNQSNIHSLKIKGSGNIDGEAKISLILNGKEYKTANLSGMVNFDWGGDWYSDSAEIIYHPINVKGGKISINYCFFNLK